MSAPLEATTLGREGCGLVWPTRPSGRPICTDTLRHHAQPKSLLFKYLEATCIETVANTTTWSETFEGTILFQLAQSLGDKDATAQAVSSFKSTDNGQYYLLRG